MNDAVKVTIEVIILTLFPSLNLLLDSQNDIKGVEQRPLYGRESNRITEKTCQ